MEGDSFEGWFKKGEFHGEGKAEFVCGDVYEGEWKNGVYHGNGILYEKSKD